MPADDTGPRERTYSIVNLDLWRERDPGDRSQAVLEDFVTAWLVDAERRGRRE